MQFVISALDGGLFGHFRDAHSPKVCVTAGHGAREHHNLDQSGDGLLACIFNCGAQLCCIMYTIALCTVAFCHLAEINGKVAAGQFSGLRFTISKFHELGADCIAVAENTGYTVYKVAFSPSTDTYCLVKNLTSA